MAQPRRGEIWSLGGRDKRLVVVVSANMFNELPDHRFVLAMEVLQGKAPELLLTTQIAEDYYVEIDTIGRVPKQLFEERLARPVDTQVLTDIHNRLFRILATN